MCSQYDNEPDFIEVEGDWCIERNRDNDGVDWVSVAWVEDGADWKHLDYMVHLALYEIEPIPPEQLTPLVRQPRELGKNFLGMSPILIKAFEGLKRYQLSVLHALGNDNADTVFRKRQLDEEGQRQLVNATGKLQISEKPHRASSEREPLRARSNTPDAPTGPPAQ